MKAGIVGLPNVGKSTLFNALTQSKAAQAANYPFCTITPNEGMVGVPDDRLERISRYITPKKLVPTAVRLVDIAGIIKGASHDEGKGNFFLGHIREVDAVLQVVRCFEDENVVHVAGRVDPAEDVATVEAELLISDMLAVDNALPKAERSARGGDKDAALRVETLRACKAHLAEERPLRTAAFDPAAARVVANYGLLTAKPILYVANVDESDVSGSGPLITAARKIAAAGGSEVIPVCAKFESELADLDGEGRAEMLEAMGLAEPALGIVARAIYKALGLHSYFTAGVQEVRAWPIPVGATAPQAAGVIHSDFEKGFIRAEVYSLADLETYKSEKEIRQAGKLRVEGKSYVVRDGDICHFLFN